MRSSTQDVSVDRRPRRLWRTVVVGLTVALALSATAAVSTSAGAATHTQTKVLGTKNVAKGSPVKVGFVSSGRSANLDNQYQVELAEAMTEYVNEYWGGIGGHVVDLDTCVSGQSNAAKAQECANSLIGDGAVMIIAGDYDAISAVHTVTAQANIPLFLYSITDPAITQDTKATFQMFDPRLGVYQLPISVAKDNKLKLVTGVIIDVPAATDLYNSADGKKQFTDAGMKVNVVPIPPGQADVTPQMAQVANGDPTEVQVIGNDAFCIAAFKGLQANGFDGPMSTLYTCITDSTKQAVGSYLKDVYISVSVPLNDTKQKDYKLMKAIIDKYGVADAMPDLSQPMNTFATFMSTMQILRGMKGEITPATITQTAKTMPNMKMIGAQGMNYRCNGKANTLLPAVCAPGGLRTQLDSTGGPILPYKVVGNAPVPD